MDVIGQIFFIWLNTIWIPRGVTHYVAQVARATPIISEFITVIWSKFHLGKMSFTLGNTNIFLEIMPLQMYVLVVARLPQMLKSTFY